MDVICLSSDSEESSSGFVRADNIKRSPCFQRDDGDDIFNVDWNDEAHPAIDYDIDLMDKSSGPVETDEQIEDYVTPCKQARKSNDADEDFSIHDATIKNELEPETNYNEYDCDYDYDVDSNDIVLLFEKVRSNTATTATTNSQNNLDFQVKNLPDTSKQNRPKLSQEEREQAKISKEQKKLERERLREEKKAEQLRQRAFKTALSENQRNLKPEENIKFLKVHIDNEIINSVCGGNIICLLQQNSIQYVVESQIKSYTITWSKRRIIKVVDDYGNVSETIESKDEEELLYVLDWQKAVELIHTNDLLSHVETVKSVYVNKNLTLVIYGLGKYFSYKKSRRNNGEVSENKRPKPKPSDRVYEDAPYISKDQLEIALIDLQLLGKHNCRLIETPEELSSLVLNFTKSLSQIEYKLERQRRQEGDLEWFAKANSSQCVKVDKNGNGLMRLWQQQICQFSSVGLEAAQAVVSNYNSPAALVSEYEKCDSREEGEMLLQNIQIRRNAGILSSTRRVGPQLSKKIYNFFMNDLPDFEL